jgi:hypothetical protein
MLFCGAIPAVNHTGARYRGLTPNWICGQKHFSPDPVLLQNE